MMMMMMMMMTDWGLKALSAQTGYIMHLIRM